MIQPSQPDAPLAPDANGQAGSAPHAAADAELSPAADAEPEFRMTPLLWTLGTLAVLFGLACGLVLSVASLGK